MDLHRTTGQPDWAAISPARYNVYQKVAAATKGIITPANLITLIGFGLVLYGLFAILMNQYWLALGALTIGRLLDIADGWAAEKTGTKSPLGEFLDAAIDKIGTLLTIFVFFIVAITDWRLITLLVLPQIVIPLVVFYKRRQSIQTHPTRIGKISMATAWASLFGLLLARALNVAWPSPVVIVVYSMIIGSAILGFYALGQYTLERSKAK